MTEPSPLIGELLGALPIGLRTEVVSTFQTIVRNYRESRWEPSELNGGKLCEVAYSILRGFADGKYPKKASKPSNFVDACRKLEHADPSRPRSIRIQIPRVLIALYEIRNNRGVGHVGGDVDPNHMDATFVVEAAKWIMAELVRLFHEVSTDEATRAVDSLVDRTTPVIWDTGATRRVLANGLSQLDKMLLLAYASQAPAREEDVRGWIEAANASAFRRDVLKKAHDRRLIEYDPKARTIEISPLGVRYVEENLSLVV